MISERPMRVATVRVFGVFLVVLAMSITLSALVELRAAARSERFDLMVGREAVAMLIAAALALAAFLGGWRLFRNPTAAVRRVIAAGIVILAASLALGMRGLEPPSTWPLTPRQREAYEYLRSSTDVEMPYIGIGGSRSRGYLAMRILRRSVAADDAFKELVRSGTPAGQLYGLCGLCHTDPFIFSATLPRYRRSTASVGFFWGCTLDTKRVADVACAEDGFRIPRGVAIDDWLRSEGNKQYGRTVDICGGSLPAAFTQRDFDETEARMDEKLAEFRRQ